MAARAHHRGAVTALLVGLLVLAPLVPVLLWSVAARWFPPDLLPEAWGLRGYRYLLGAGASGAIRDSATIAASAAAACLVLAWPAGRVLGGPAFRGQSVLRVALLLPAMLPSMASGLGLHQTFLHLGLADTGAGVVLAHLVPALPYAIVALAGAFASYDPRVEQAAANLGASRARVLWSVTLPLLAPGILVAGLMAFIISWSQYTLTLLVGGGIVVTLPILLYSLASGGDLHLMAATAVVFVVPILVLFPLTSRALSGRAVGGATR